MPLRKDLFTMIILSASAPILIAIASYPIYLIYSLSNSILILLVLSAILSAFLAFYSYSALRKQYFAILDFFDGIVGLEVYGSGIGRFIPLKLDGGKIIHPEVGEIGTYDTENAVINLNIGNPEKIAQLKLADAIFRVAGKPMIIIDGVNKYVLNRKLLSFVESQIENFASTIARLSNLMIEKASALEPALAMKMTRGGRIMNFLTAHGKEIALIILVVAIGLSIFYYVYSMGSRGEIPGVPQMPIWGGR